jgi:hypothetical protein
MYSWLSKKQTASDVIENRIETIPNSLLMGLEKIFGQELAQQQTIQDYVQTKPKKLFHFPLLNKIHF